MKLKLLVFILSIVFLSSCKEEEKTDSVNNQITAHALKNSKLSSGVLKRIDSFSSKFIAPRTVDIWLPENYSKTKKYAVLYMHDGQMLFDSTTTWNKQEWMVDEIASKLMNEGITKDFMVVGTYSISDIRWQDLFPQKAMDYMEKTLKDSILSDAKKNNFNVNFKGDDYLKFMIKELKPFIDSNYSTYSDREHTFVGGSSMGGLMSMYAVCEYPEVFGGAACLSTHWPGIMPSENNPLPLAIFTYLESKVPMPNSHKFYFDFGTKTLDQYYPQYKTRVDEIFKNKGYTKANFMNLKFEGHDHSELSWQKRLDIPLTFLLKK